MSRGRINGIVESLPAYILLGGAVILANKFGLFTGKSKSEKDSSNVQDKVETGNADYWTGQYWHDIAAKQKLNIITQAAANTIAKGIDSAGDTDSSLVVGLFNQIKAKTDLSRVVERYAALTGKSLYSELKKWGNLSWQQAPLTYLFGGFKGNEDALNSILNRIEKLPDSR